LGAESGDDRAGAKIAYPQPMRATLASGEKTLIL
jgi:hypothetical protein